MKGLELEEDSVGSRVWDFLLLLFFWFGDFGGIWGFVVWLMTGMGL